MSDRISLLLPTRGRPLLVRRLFNSILDYTADTRSLEIVLCMDEDDTESHRLDEEKLDIVRTIGPRSTMGAYNTICLEKSSGNIIMLMNDDLTVCTPGWDEIIINFCRRFEDGIFLAYPDDMERAHLSTFPIMSRKTCEILCRPYPEEYDDLFIDDHLFDIFIRLKHAGYNRMFYLDNVIIDHRHFINGKVRPDAGYKHKNRYKDYLTFMALRHLRQASARRLQSAIEGAPLPDLPKGASIEIPPANLLRALIRSFSVFMLDRGLPLSRRALWFMRFTKYYGAMKSGLGFLKRKSYKLYGSK